MLSWVETVAYVIFTLASTTSLSVALFIVYRRYKKLQKKLEELATKVSVKNENTHKRVKVDGDTVIRILNLYRQGLSYRQISKIIGVSHTTVGRVVRKYYKSIEIREQQPITKRVKQSSSS